MHKVIWLHDDLYFIKASVFWDSPEATPEVVIEDVKVTLSGVEVDITELAVSNNRLCEKLEAKMRKKFRQQYRWEDEQAS